MAKRHRKATQTTESGIVSFAAPMHHSKVMLIDPKTDAPTRIRRRKDADGTIERVAVKSGDTIQRNR
jgi:large subunit ribosomal protein L24